MVSSPITRSSSSNIPAATNALLSSSTNFIQSSREDNCLRVGHFDPNSFKTCIETLKLFLIKALSIIELQSLTQNSEWMMLSYLWMDIIS